MTRRKIDRKAVYEDIQNSNKTITQIAKDHGISRRMVYVIKEEAENNAKKVMSFKEFLSLNSNFETFEVQQQNDNNFTIKTK